MKKNLFLNVFTVLLLLSTSFGVPSANAAPGDGLQFCFKATTNADSKPELEFRQRTSTETGGEGEVCFDSWYDQKATHNPGSDEYGDAYTYVNDWLNQPANADSYIAVKSNISFAGREGDACIEGKNAFNGKMLKLENSNKVLLYGSSTSHNYTISGLCFTSTNDDRVSFLNGDANVQNVNFDNVYFKSTKDNSKVGIVAENNDKSKHAYQHIHVKNSEFYGDYAGAVLGYGHGYISNISLTNIVINGGTHAGGVVGQLVADASNLGGGSTNDVFNQFNIQNLKIAKALNSSDEPIFTKSDNNYFGGIVGHLTYDTKRTVTGCDLTDLDIQGAAYAGGLFGQTYYNGTDADATEYSEIYIGKTGTTESVIKGSMFVGGLIGYVNEGSFDDTKITVTKAGVNANVIGGGDAASVVGGLIGFINYFVSNELELTIEHNYVVGEVSGVADKSKIGYLVGDMILSAVDWFYKDKEDNKIDVSSVRFNYHYGPYDDAANYAVIGIGPFNLNNLKPDPGHYEEHWITGQVRKNSEEVPVNVVHNYRNAVVDKLDPSKYALGSDGRFIYDYNQSIFFSVYDIRNGVIETDEMKTSVFAAFLSQASFTNFGKNVWSLQDDVNNGLPFLTSNGVFASKQIYSVAFEIPSGLYTIVDKGITDGDIKGDLIYGYCGSGCDAVLLFTNTDGKLDASEVEFMNSLLETDAFWDGSPALSSSQVYTNGNTIYTYKKSATALTYNLEFTIPESLRDKDLFVINKKGASGEREVDWFLTQDNVTTATVVAPPLYNSEGCNIYWKSETDLHEAPEIKDELQYLVPIEAQSGYVNTLVPDFNHPKNCPTVSVSDHFYRISLDHSGEGEVILKQVLSYTPQVPGDPDHIEVRHSFKKDGSGWYLNIPRVLDGDGNNLGVKFTVETKAKDGHILKTLYSGAGTSAEIIKSGDELDVLSEMDWTAEFVPLEPVYVTYDLSLKTAEDSSKTYLPVDAVVAGSLKMNLEDDEIPLWKPYRTDKCFIAWSTAKADELKPEDPQWNSLSALNYLDFSKDESAPTKLYALWETCSPTTTMVVKNGNEHTTLVLSQSFDSKVLRHEIPATGLALVGPAYDFIIDDVKTVIEAGYSVDFSAYKLAYTYATSSGTSEPKNVTKVAGAWRVSSEGIPNVPTYTFTSTVALKDFTVVFNENSAGATDKVFFGDPWDAYISKESFDVDDDGNWTVKMSYNQESVDKSFPLALHRDGYCMYGYTFDKNDDADGLYTDLTDDFMNKYTERGDGPTILYPYWVKCEDGATIKLADTDKGTYKFTRKFDLGENKTTPERVYEVSSANFKVPSGEGDVSFTGISFIVNGGAGVIVDDNAKFSYRKESDTQWTDFTGDLFTVKKGVDNIKAPLLKNSYEFAYSKNAPDNVVVFESPLLKEKETYTIESASESKDLQSLDVLARTDACRVGWAWDDKGEKVLNAFDIDALRTLDAVANSGTSTQTLYAVWEPKGSGCTPKTFKIASGMDAAQGAFTAFYTVDGKTFEFDVDMNGIEIPVVEGLQIGVKFAGTKAYKYGKNIIGSSINGNTLFDVENGNAFTVDALQVNVSLTVEATPVEYAFALKANTSSDDVFLGSDFESRLPESFFSYNQELPTDVYRSDAKLAGWSLKSAPGASDLVAKKIDDEFIEAYKKFVEKRGTTSKIDTLYAVWTADNARKTFKVTMTNLVEEGSFELQNASNVYSLKAGETLEIPAEKDVSYAISFKRKSYNKNEYFNIEVLDEKGKQLAKLDLDGKYAFESNASLHAVGDFKPIVFTLDLNAGEKSVFFGDGFSEFFWTVQAFQDAFPMNAYRADAKLVGWSLEKKADKGYITFDAGFNETYETYLTTGSYSVNFDPAHPKNPVLYAVWKNENVSTYTVTADSTNKGTLTLRQSVGDTVYAHVVPTKGLKVPVADDIEFKAHFEVDPSWLLDADKPLVWTSAKGAKESTENDTFRRITGDVKVSVVAKSKEVHLVFNVTSADSVFYGSDWKTDVKYGSADGKTVSLPTMVYNTDSCLAGWSTESESGSAWTNLSDSLLNVLYAAYPDLGATTKVKLFARWTDKVENCAGNITRASVEVKHGNVQLVEKIGKTKYVHKFNKKGTMMLPAEIDSTNWTLSVTPDSGYVLDSLVVVRKNKVVAVLHDGDHLPKNMENVVLKAYFVKSNDSPIKIVEKTFDKSGNAIRLIYKTSDFDAMRNVFAKVKIVDIAEKKTPVIDTTLSKSVAPSSSNEVIFFVMHPGTFKLVFSIGDGEETDEFSKEFTIDSQIASLKANQWTMISLAAVDTSSISWNEGCSFYWWDESGVGEYWQYHSFKRGDEIVGNQGYWFSPWNGGSLVMRKNLKDDGKDIVWNLEHKLSGWNLVANPHGWSVDLYSMNESALKDVDEESEVRFYRYDPETGGYVEILEETRYLAPYEAVWAQVSKKTTWKISAEPVFDSLSSASTSKPEPLAKAATKDRWMLQAVLSDRKGKRDSWNILGVGNNPFVADEPPASMGDHVNLSIVEGKRALAKSIRAASDEMEWTVNLSASGSREGFLSFAGIDGVQSFGYRVFVTVDGETIEMHEGKPLPVSLNSSKKTATVRVTKGAPVVAAKQSLIKGLRSMTVGNQLHVSFEASEGLAGERTKVELLDVKGKVVATASARTLAGTNAVTMKLPKMGVYIIRVRIGSQQHSSRILVK